MHFAPPWLLRAEALQAALTEREAELKGAEEERGRLTALQREAAHAAEEMRDLLLRQGEELRTAWRDMVRAATPRVLVCCASPLLIRCVCGCACVEGGPEGAVHPAFRGGVPASLHRVPGHGCGCAGVPVRGAAAAGGAGRGEAEDTGRLSGDAGGPSWAEGG